MKIALTAINEGLMCFRTVERVATVKDAHDVERRINEAVTLTREDWIEIYYALNTKAHDIGNGDLGGETHDSTENGCHPDCEACENVRWVKHLERIQKKIGEDAERAIKYGVKAGR